MIDGRILYANGTEMWLAHGRRLVYSDDNGQSWKQRWSLPIYKVVDLLSISRIGRRFGRVGFHHLVKTELGHAVVAANGSIFTATVGEQKLKWRGWIRGSRPLSLCAGNGLVCYGEYKNNTSREPVHIWGARINQLEDWRPLYTLRGVRHIHGVFFDRYSQSFWITTGDRDEECGIYQTYDHFKTLDRVLGGKQQYRAVTLLFTCDYVYFGTDAPDERNYIYRYHRASGEIERLQPVGGPIFFGTCANGYLCFSTVVEPSSVNTSQSAEIWYSTDGNTWHLAGAFKKDWLANLKYFQYPQVLFPNGPGDDASIWVTPMSTVIDQKSVMLSID